ncbi:MAG: hypothetical protein ACJ762_01915 [Solirubrobacteraceae bacterium]
MSDLLRRRVIPSTIIRVSAIDRPARIGAALRRARGGRGRVDLYFAFDDPCSAAALLDLTERLATRPVDLVALPVVERGIPDDPAVEDKRTYAIEDARRLFRRRGLELGRTEPIAAAATAALAAHAMTLAPQERLAFCADALARLWLEGADVTAPGGGDENAVRANERAMVERGPYDTPAAMIGRDWWFAHDRLAQIAERLDRLGWTAR